MGSSTIQVYMTHFEPSVIEVQDLDGISTSEDDEIVVKLVPENQSSLEITCPLLGEGENYVMALWDPGKQYLSWERTYIEYNNSDQVSPQPSIKIVVKQPHSDLTVIPWWRETTTSARNPDKILPHFPFIFKNFRGSSIELGEIPNNSSEDDNFNKDVYETHTHYETQPIVRPGEYIALQWVCKVNGKLFYSPTFNLKYETPLFTGGWIVSKIGEGIETRYAVEIFGEVVSDIVPTDFYDYQVGKWVYLMKIDANLELDPLKENKQLYGSEGIDEAGEASDILKQVNTQRSNNGLDPLFQNAELSAIAQSHANDLALHGITGGSGHIGSDGSTPTERVTDSGYLDDVQNNNFSIGENIAFIEDPESGDVVANWMNSTSHRSNILNVTFLETGVGKATNKDGEDYYVQVFGYRELENDTAIYNGKYRIVPFNFKGPMNTECAVPFEHSIDLDSSIEFEEVFDMIHYQGEISNVDYNNDTASIDIDGEVKTDVPIFYYCDGQDEPTIVGGSSAFTDGDICVVEVPNGVWDEKAKIIGFPEEIKQCIIEFIGDASILDGQLYYADHTFSQAVGDQYGMQYDNPVSNAFFNSLPSPTILYIDEPYYSFLGNDYFKYVYGETASGDVTRRKVLEVVTGETTVIKIDGHRIHSGSIDVEYDIDPHWPYDPLENPIIEYPEEDPLYQFGTHIRLFGFTGSWTVLNDIVLSTVIDEDYFEVEIDTSEHGVFDPEFDGGYLEIMPAIYGEWERWFIDEVIYPYPEACWPEPHVWTNSSYGYRVSQNVRYHDFGENSDRTYEDYFSYNHEYPISIINVDWFSGDSGGGCHWDYDSPVANRTDYQSRRTIDRLHNTYAIFKYKPDDLAEEKPYRSRLRRPYRVSLHIDFDYTSREIYQYEDKGTTSIRWNDDYTDFYQRMNTREVYIELETSYTKSDIVLNIYDWDDEEVYEYISSPVTQQYAKYINDGSGDPDLADKLDEQIDSTGGSFFFFDRYHLYNHNGKVGLYGYIANAAEIILNQPLLVIRDHYEKSVKELSQVLRDRIPESAIWTFVPLEDTDDTVEGNMYGWYKNDGIFEDVIYPHDPIP